MPGHRLVCDLYGVHMMAKMVLWILLVGGVLSLVGGCFYDPYAYESTPYAYQYGPSYRYYAYRGYPYPYPYRHYSYYLP